MKSKLVFALVFLMAILLNSCNQQEKATEMNIIYLHHSIGAVIWQGSKIPFLKRVANKINPKLANIVGKKAKLPSLFEKYNEKNNKNYSIKEMIFPKKSPYGWNNNPFDYYNIWVKNAGNKPYLEEPTLEILTRQYQLIIFKHCDPVSSINDDQDSGNINSNYRSISNYKLQYTALRNKLHEFPNTKFILFTGASLGKAITSEDKALRAKEFFQWVTDEWDIPGDNIYIWDFYNLQTEGGLYFKDEYAVSPTDSHPNGEFAGKVVQLLFNRIIDIIENEGSGTKLTGEKS